MNFKKTLDEQGSAANEATGEVVYGIFRNVDATTSDVGDTTCLAITTPNRPGLDVDQCGSSGATVDTVVGIWTEAVAQSKNGLVQLYGYYPKVLMGLSSVVAGDSLKAVSGQDYCAPLIANHSGPSEPLWS